MKNYDPSNGPFPPHVEHSVLTLTHTSVPGGDDILYENGYLYLINAANGGSLRIFRTDSPTPELLGEVTGLGNTRQIELSNDAVPGRILAAVTARECGLYLIDVTDPVNPYICCHYNTVEFATGVAFGGHYLAIGCRTFGVELLDVETPEHPRHICSFRAGEVQSVFISGGILYTGSWGDRQVNVIDISNVRTPSLLAVIPLEGRGDGLYVKDGILYAAFGQHHRRNSDTPDGDGYGRGNGFAIWDVHDPAHPKQLSSTFFPYRYFCCNWDMWDITVCGNYAVVSHTFNGVWIYDITDLRAPRLVDHAAIRTDIPMAELITMNETTLKLRPMIFPFDFTAVSYAPVTGVAAADGKLYIAAGRERLHIAKANYFSPTAKPSATLSEYGENFYIQNPGSKTENATIVPTVGQAHAAVSYDGQVWVACGMGGISVFDTALTLLNRIPVPGFAMDIREQNGLFYVAAGKAGIVILRPDGSSLTEIGRLSLDGKSCAQAVPSENGRFLMVHTDDQHLTIVDVSDPSHPKVAMQEHYEPGLVYHRQISYDGVGGQYYGCYWNSNLTHWYDLSGSVPKEAEFRQGMLGPAEGLTGLRAPYQALAIVRGGYVIADIRNPKPYSDYEIHRIDGVQIKSKPVVWDGILYAFDRPSGEVTICNITDPAVPKLIGTYTFSGWPDLPCPIDGGVILPLGHQGIAKIVF